MAFIITQINCSILYLVRNSCHTIQQQVIFNMNWEYTAVNSTIGTYLICGFSLWTQGGYTLLGHHNRGKCLVMMRY